jgi:hypothetical protein
MDSRLLVLGALGLLAGGQALTRGSRGAVRRGFDEAMRRIDAVEERVIAGESS